MPYRFPDNWSSARVALCHDWLTGMRGGERVLDLLCEGFPDAELYTLIHNRLAVSDTINKHKLHTSFLQSIPGVLRRYRYYLPLFPLAIRSVGIPDADIVISTSHCVAKAIRKQPHARHLCYCFTPMRYAWTFYGEYFGGNPLKKAVLKPTLAALRNWDRKASSRVDHFVAISHHIRRRIEIYYARQADVVYPPVNTDYYTPGVDAANAAVLPQHLRETEPGSFDLIVSALVPYKRLDLAVQAYTRLGFPLKIVGTGTEFDTLDFLAGDNVEFLGWQPDPVVRELYRRCRQLIFPGEEDFGIVPVEAQACGKPVVAYGRGGVTETVIDGKTGIYFNDQDEEAFLGAVNQCASLPWDPALIRKNAERFSTQNFITALDASLQKMLDRQP